MATRAPAARRQALSLDLVRAAADQIAGEPRFAITLLGGAEVFGLDRFDGGAMIVKGRFKTRLQKQAEVLRASPAFEQWMTRVAPDTETPPTSSRPPAAPA